MNGMLRFSETGNPAHKGINNYAVRCLLSRKQPLDARELRTFATDLMNTLARECFLAGAKDIGHIKAYIEHPSGFLRADTVGSPEDVMVEGRDGSPTNNFEIVINVVVYGLDKATLKCASEQAMTIVSAAFSLVAECAEKYATPNEPVRKGE